MLYNNQYSTEREYLSEYIQLLVNDNTIIVSNIKHGNSNRQIHLYLTKSINEGLATQGDELIFVNLNGEIPVGVNVYSNESIQLIKQSISKESIEAGSKTLNKIVE